MTPLIESITRIDNWHGLSIRVWRTETFIDSMYAMTRRDIEMAIGNYYQIPDIVYAIAALPHVNAIEVTRDGQGVVYYTDWP